MPKIFHPIVFELVLQPQQLCVGISEEDIKRLGRWKSAAFKFYIRPNQLFSII